MTEMDRPWWHKDSKNKRHSLIFQLVKEQYMKQMQRYLTMRRYISVYEYGYRASTRLTSKDKWVNDTMLYFNIAANAVDTYISQICAPSLSVMAATEGGSYSDMDRAKLNTRAMQGAFDALNVQQNEADAVKFFALCGAGFVKYSIANGRIESESVCPLDILVDEMESRGGEPRCMYHRVPMDKYVAAEVFGNTSTKRDAIMKAPRFFTDTDDDIWSSPNIVAVIEAWHLPSTPSATDGRHSVVIEGVTLVDEPWEHDCFPIVDYRPKKSALGYWGVPLMRFLAPAQKERERLDQCVQRAMRRMGGSHWLIHRDSKMATRQMTNDSGDQWDWEGTIPPTPIAPAPVNDQLLQYRESIPVDAMRYVGISPLAAQSQVPAGLQQASGKALTVFEQAESKRNILDHRERERFNTQSARVITMLIRDLIEENPDYSIDYARGKNMFERFKWKEILLPEDKCVFRVYPISALSQNPSEKFAELDTLLNAEVIDAPTFKRLFGMPDIEGEFNLENSDENMLFNALDSMVMTGKYVQIESFDDFDLILRKGRAFYQMCRDAKVPEERLNLIRTYLTDAKAEMDKVKAAQAPPGPTGGAPQQDSGPPQQQNQALPMSNGGMS